LVSIHLVGLANEFDVEQGITLAVGGAMISGQLISGKRYFEELAAFTMSATADSEEVKAAIAKSIKACTVIYDKPEGVPPDDYIAPPPTYIHLRNALWIYPDGKALPTNRGVLWRGKLAAVDGFCLGQTAPASEHGTKSSC
jgi:hypothetical protein